MVFDLELGRIGEGIVFDLGKSGIGIIIAESLVKFFSGLDNRFGSVHLRLGNTMGRLMDGEGGGRGGGGGGTDDSGRFSFIRAPG